MDTQRSEDFRAARLDWAAGYRIQRRRSAAGVANGLIVRAICYRLGSRIQYGPRSQQVRLVGDSDHAARWPAR